MNLSSHTAPAGVIQRVSFDAYDSEAYGEQGDGYLDFDRDGNLVNDDTQFRVRDCYGAEHPFVAVAREYAQTH